MNATAMKPRLGDQRYLAVWCDAASLKAAAREAGWDEQSDVGPLDHADTAEHERYVQRASFDAAVAFAASKIDADYWGCPRVYLQEFGPADVPAPARAWEDVKFWDIEADGTATEQVS
jgi:hypothetical protein